MQSVLLIGAVGGRRSPATLAFQSSGNRLWVIGTADNKGDTGLGMAPGTSPSITSMPNNGWQATFQGSDGRMWVVGSVDDKGSLSLGLAPGTSPSITSVGPR